MFTFLRWWSVSALEQAYYSANDTLPVIFYSSGATEGNADAVRPIMNDIINANYAELIVKYDEIQGSHDGILNTAMSRGFDWIGAQIPDTSD